MNKKVYFFGEGSRSDTDLLGGKGANLNEMTKIGIPVPPGFTITTEMCNAYLNNRHTWPDDLKKDIEKQLVAQANLD